jgi:hypothetical protein
MILTKEQREQREQAVRHVTVLGPQPCHVCGGSMVVDINEDEVGWACILCPHERKWNIPSADGYRHLRTSGVCRGLTRDTVLRIFRRLEQGYRQIEIVREFHINRQTAARLKVLWEERYKKRMDESA